ncbi:MAG: Sua5/YciO/YrdC/YwlC family protein, partial [Deltaproteobacteria bacterium]|nr:Sua5/YciO/YrdC/YwlC family protein [Deltaproteobacteria bacterium]
MSSRIVSVHTEADLKAGLTRASGIIRSGGVVAFPTESFYGLGVDATDEDAVQRLIDVKERRGDHPILI